VASHEPDSRHSARGSNPAARLRRHPGLRQEAAELVALYPLYHQPVLGGLLGLFRVVPYRTEWRTEGGIGHGPDRIRTARLRPAGRREPLDDEPESDLRGGRKGYLRRELRRLPPREPARE